MRRKQIKEVSSTARMLRRGSSRGVSAASRIDWTAGQPSGRSVGRSGSLTRTVADPSVDYSGDLTWTWKQVLGIRFSILHTTLINAARLLHRIGTYAAYGALDALGRMRCLVIPSDVTYVVCSTTVSRPINRLRFRSDSSTVGFLQQYSSYTFFSSNFKFRKIQKSYQLKSMRAERYLPISSNNNKWPTKILSLFI